MRRPLIQITIGDHRVAALLERLAQQMAATQADIDALTTRIDTSTTAITTAVAGIRADIDALKGTNPDLDLTALSAKVDALEAAAGGTTELDAENPVPEPIA